MSSLGRGIRIAGRWSSDASSIYAHHEHISPPKTAGKSPARWRYKHSASRIPIDDRVAGRRTLKPFKALVIRRDEGSKQQSAAFETVGEDALMDGDVDVRVEASTVNYKDGLAITGKLPVVRRFPMIPGVDLAGTVMRSARPDFRDGDKVLLNGWGVGETHLG